MSDKVIDAIRAREARKFAGPEPEPPAKKPKAEKKAEKEPKEEQPAA